VYIIANVKLMFSILQSKHINKRQAVVMLYFRLGIRVECLYILYYVIWWICIFVLPACLPLISRRDPIVCLCNLLVSVFFNFVSFYLLCDQVCQWLATGQWFSPGTKVSSTNKTDRCDIAEILLKVVLIKDLVWYLHDMAVF